MKPNRILRLNAGFLLKEGVGYSREFEFDEPLAQVADDLETSNLRGRVRLTRTPQGLYVSGHLTAATPAECVRCLEAFDQAVYASIADLFVYPAEDARPGDLTVGDDAFVDLTLLVREGMLLSMPMQTLCRPDCRGLCPICGANRNFESCDCAEDEVDPRLAVLKLLLPK